MDSSFGDPAAPRAQDTDSDHSNTDVPAPSVHHTPSPIIPEVSDPEAIISGASTSGPITPLESSPQDSPPRTDSPHGAFSTAALLGASKDEVTDTAPKPVSGPPPPPGFYDRVTKAEEADATGPEVKPAGVQEKGSSVSSTLAGSKPTEPKSTEPGRPGPESKAEVDKSKPTKSTATAPKLSGSNSDESKPGDAAPKENNPVDFKAKSEAEVDGSKPTDPMSTMEIEPTDPISPEVAIWRAANFKACPVVFPWYPEETCSGPWDQVDPAWDNLPKEAAEDAEDAPASKMGGIKIPVVIKSEITADESVNPTTPVPETGSRQDRTMLLFARVMEGGKEDEETTADLAKLTKLLVEEPELTKQGKEPIVPVIDADCLDTLFGCLDMRQPEAVRTQATLCTAAYLNASGLEGKRKVTDFFHAKMQRATYDDYIVAFCAATAIFPLEYDLMAELFHIEGFLPSLGSLMTRKWKSKKIEMACLKMLNAAAMKIKCHAAIYKYCNEWLDDIISDDIEARLDTVWHLDTDLEVEKEGADELRRHCKQVRNLAGVVYMKISVSEFTLGKLRAYEKSKWFSSSGLSKFDDD